VHLRERRRRSASTGRALSRRRCLHKPLGCRFTQVWQWETLYHVHESGQKTSAKASDTDVLGGIGARYWLSRHWQAGLSYERYRIDEQDVDLIGLNVVYQFGSRLEERREPAPIVSTPPAPVAGSAPGRCANTGSTAGVPGELWVRQRGPDSRGH
jgi:hypothetical protein